MNGIAKIKCNLGFSGYCSINALHWTAGYGIYCVFSERSINPAHPIYIGQAECLASRIDEHRGDEETMEKWKTEARKLDPTCKNLYVSYTILNSEEDLFYVEPAIVFRLQPRCNTHYINKFPDDRPRTHIKMSGPNRLLCGNFKVYPGQIREFLRPYDWGD